MRIISGVLVPAALFVLAALLFVFVPPPVPVPPAAYATPISIEGASGTISLSVEVADTAAERGRGLSDTEALEERQGMLFVFEKPGVYEFWMKGMRFPIDILWLNGRGEIIGMETDIATSTYPKVFMPKEEILYALEVPAGFVREHKVSGGEIVRVP